MSRFKSRDLPGMYMINGSMKNALHLSQHLLKLVNNNPWWSHDIGDIVRHFQALNPYC
jgi:hypothetical protein